MPSSPTPETVKMTTPDTFKNLPEPYESYLSRKSNGRMGSQIEKSGTEEPQTDSAVSQDEITRKSQDRRSSDLTILSIDLDYQDNEYLDEVFHAETQNDTELQDAHKAGHVTTSSTEKMTEKTCKNKGNVVAESYAATKAVLNETEHMDTTMLEERIPEEPKREWKTKTGKRNRKNNNTALMLALSQAENGSRPDDNTPVTKSTTTQAFYKPPKRVGVKPHSSELLYNWTPSYRQVQNWREENLTGKQRVITRNFNNVKPKSWSPQESKGNRRFQRGFQRDFQQIERYGDMNTSNRHHLEQALACGRWSEIKKSLKQLEGSKQCMTRSLSKKLSEWLEFGTYRAFLRRDYNKERFPVSLWPYSERGARGCVTLADPVILLPYLNFPALHTSLSGISAEAIWIRLDRSERLRLLREAHGCGLRPDKKH